MCNEKLSHGEGSEFAESSKYGTGGQLLRDSDLPPEVKSANLGFFLEALTPAFASFWVIAHILTQILTYSLRV